MVIDNDGGGIFHRLPVAEHEAFEEWFKTPHGLDFAPTGPLYDVGFERVDSTEAFRAAFSESVGTDGTSVIVVESDAAASQRARERLRERVCDDLADDG